MALINPMRFILTVLTLLPIISNALKLENLVNFISESYNYTVDDVGIHYTKFQDMPKIEDLSVYLDSIGEVLRFTKAHKVDIDINYSFGLFLVNVNLRTVLHRKHKSVPVTLVRELQDIIKTNTELLHFFYKMVGQDNNPNNQKFKQIAALFWNETVWVERVGPFSHPLPLDPKWHNRQRFNNWGNYKATLRADNNKPGPAESDLCISSMVANGIKWSTPHKCNLHKECYNILTQGSEFGYSITHRLLLLLLARFGRGCFVFTPKEDKEMSTRFCSSVYAEAEFIAMNNFQFIDLLMEQMLLCSLAGHIPFLHRTWLAKILQHQQKDGCFGLNGDEVKDVFNIKQPQGATVKWAISKNVGTHGLLGGKCDGHMTAVAAGALSAGARLLIALSDFHALNPESRFLS